MTLQDFFAEHPKVAIAFSGGVDSSYLLYAARQYAKEVCAYYANAEFQPAFELEDAARLAKELDVRLEILELNILEVPHVGENSSNRCYWTAPTLPMTPLPVREQRRFRSCPSSPLCVTAD